MNRQIERFKGASQATKGLFIAIIVGMVLIGLYAFFTSELGRTITLVCCGGVVLVIVVGVLSERGMRG